MSIEADNAAPSEGAMTTEQAVAALQTAREAPAGADEREDEQPPADDGQDQDQQPVAQTGDDAEAPGEDPASGGDEAEEAAPAEPASEAPHFWAAEDKALFAQLSPEAQAAVGKYEEQRVRGQNEAIERAARERQGFVESAQAATAVREKLEHAYETGSQLFTARWAGVDLLEIAQEHGPETAQVLREQHDADVAALREIEASIQEAETVRYRAFATEQLPLIAERLPDLVDKVKGPPLRKELNKFLSDEGFSAEEIRWAGANALTLAYDAMRFRKLSGAPRSSTPSSQGEPQPRRPVAKPAAPAVARTPHQRTVEQARTRLNSTGSVDDAVALLRAKRKA